MKQTNNALKFLLAQYRAIFKNAYVKGLASAVLLTAGLALAGTAQAAQEIDGTDVTIPTESGAGAVFDGEINRGDIYLNSGGNYVHDLTINGGSLNSATLKDTPETLSGHLMVAGTINVKDGGTLNLSASGNGWGIMGWDGSTSGATADTNAHLGALVVNGGTVINTQSQIQLGSITFNGADVTIGGNFNRASQSSSVWIDNAMINAEDSGGKGGEFTITGDSTVTMKAGSQLLGHEINVDNSTITFASGSTAMEYYASTALSKEKNTAMILAFADSDSNSDAVLNLNNGANVVVEEGGAGALMIVASEENSGASINFNSGSEVTVENGGTLVLGQRPFKKSDSTYKGEHVINFNDGSVLTNEGTLTFIQASSGTVTTNINTGSQIINSGEESVAEIGAGNTVIMKGGTLTNEGVLDIQEGGALQAMEQYSETATGTVINDGVVSLAGAINVGGKLTVHEGSLLDLTGVTALGTNATTDGNNNGIIKVYTSKDATNTSKATLKVNAETLKSFLASGDSNIVGTGTDKAGAVLLNDAVLDLGAEATINDFTFVSSGSGAAGQIAIRTDSTVKAESMAATNVIKVATSTASSTVAEKLHLEVNNFSITPDTAGFNAINNADGKIGFADATVHSNLNVQYTGNTPLQVGNKYYLEAYTKNEADGTLSPAAGTITGREFNLVNGGSLNVNAGNWTAQQAITVGSGASITVDTARDADATKKLTDSSLKLNGLVFDLSANSATPSVTVQNTAGQKTGDTYYSSTLDLTAGVSVSNTVGASASGSITVKDTGATVIMTGADISDILQGDKNNRLGNIGLMAQGGGTLQSTTAVSAGYGDLKSGTTVAANELTFSGAGVFEAPSLTLNGQASADGSTGTTLDIGSGVINVDTLTLNESGGNTIEDDSTIVLAGGDINVTTALTAQSDILNVGGAYVSLDTGDATTAGTLGIKDLTITGGTLAVDQGTWHNYLSNVTVNGGSLTVGNDGYSDGASFAANLLTVGTEDGTGVYVDDLGKASFTAADLSAANTGAISVAGEMVIEGAKLDMNNDKVTDENHHGLYFGKNNKTTGIFDVDGGTLTFGAEATKTFYDSTLQGSGHGTPVMDTENSGNVAYYLPNVDESAQDKLSVQNGGMVTLTFTGVESFNKQQILDLKEKLFADIGTGAGETKLDGFFNIGSVAISGITISGGTVSWSELEPFTDIVWDTTNTELGSAKVTDITHNTPVGGAYGSLEAVNGTDEVTLVSNTTLSNAAGNQGNFIGTADGTTIGATVSADQILQLNGTGNVGKITLNGSQNYDDETAVVFNATESGDAINVTGNINSTINSNSTVTASGAGTTTVQGNVAANDVGADLGSTFVITGDLNAEDLWATGGTLEVQRDVTTKNLNALQGSTLSVAGDLTLSANGTGTTVLEDNSSLSVAGDLTVAATHGAGTLIRVGSDDISHTEYDNAQQPDGSNPYDRYVNSAEDNTSGLISNTASTGYMEVLGEVNLNGATLYVDPSYDMNTSMVSLAKFADNNLNRGQLGTLDGNIVVGKNAAVGLGVTNAQLAQIIERYQTNGALREGEYGSVLYVAGQLNVADGQTIALNSNARNTTLANIEADFGSSAAATAADLSLGSNTALIISDNAVQAAAASTESAHDAAIEFNKAGASIYAQADAAVLLDGTTFSLNGIKLFDDADGNGVKLTTADGNGLYVGTVSGLFETWIKDGDGVGTVQLGITRHGLDDTALSNPVRDSIYNLLGATVLIEEPVTPPTTEEQPSTDGEDDTTTPPADGEQENINQEQKVATASVTPIAAPTTGTYENRYLVEQGSFIATALAEQRSLQSVEQAARLGAYAGTMQATLGASSTTTDAIAGRMGMGAQAGTITYADNAQGAALWVTPVYKSHSSDGFDAEGADYGVDVDLYGLALGADYTLGNGLRVGAMFNVGSGDADGNGVASGVSNDFDYYSFGVYGGYTMGALSVLADLSYTSVDNDFDANTGLTTYEKLEGSADSDALSLGVTAQYAFDMQSVTVTPHAGLRFTRLSLDDYGVQSGGVEVAGMSSDNLNVFSIPVGVTFASEFNAGSWSVQPALDLTLTGNFGDTDLDADSCWSGTDNGYDDLSYGVSTEFLDDFTYGATLGIAAKTGNFSLGLGVNYTGSSNTDEYGVTANARFVF